MTLRASFLAQKVASPKSPIFTSPSVVPFIKILAHLISL